MPRCELCDHYDTDPCIPNDERAADRLYRYHDIVNTLDALEAEIDDVEAHEAAGIDVDQHHVQDLLDEIEALQEDLDELLAEEATAKEVEQMLAEVDAITGAVGGDSIGANDESVEENVDFYEYDISNEESRVYSYPDGDEITIEAPQTLYEDPATGQHLIIDVGNVGVTVRPGWSDITHYPRYGEAPFKFID